MGFRSWWKSATGARGDQRGEAAEVTLEAGQVWRYRTRPGEEASRLRILLIEHDERLGQIAHVRVEGVQIANPVVPQRPNTVLGHVPIDPAALRASITEWESTTSEAPDLEGYREWRDAEGGVFTLAVADVVQAIADTMDDAPSADPDRP